jgi:curved DNA-binding protein CbpA
VKRLAEQSLYEILEIPRDAPADEVERAYERAKALYSPGSLATYTLMDPDEAALLGRRIEEARAVLLDPVMRAGYDAGLAPEPRRDGRGERPLPPVIPPVKAPPQQPERAGQQIQAPSEAPLEASRASPPAVASSDSPPEPPMAAAPLPAPEDVAAPAAASLGRPAGEASGAQAAPASPAQPPRLAPSSPHPGYSIPEGGPWTGEVLRRVREARGMTLQQIAERTKVTRHHLENIEADRYARLPAPVYLRGILMSLAKELRLDGQKVARSYLEQVAAAQAVPPPPVRGR